MYRFSFTFLLVVCCGAQVQDACSQDYPSTSGFFEENFVGSMLEPNDESTDKQDQAARDKAKNFINKLKKTEEEARADRARAKVDRFKEHEEARKTGKDDKTESTERTDKAESEKSEPSEDSEQEEIAKIKEDPKEAFYRKAIPVEAVSFVTSTVPLDHAIDNIRRFSDVLIQYKLRPKKVYTIGTYIASTDIPSDWMKVVARGGTISHNYQVLEKYKLKHSPAWILHLPSGDVVIEGENNLSKLLTAKGEFKQEFLHNKELR